MVMWLIMKLMRSTVSPLLNMTEDFAIYKVAEFLFGELYHSLSITIT